MNRNDYNIYFFKYFLFFGIGIAVLSSFIGYMVYTKEHESMIGQDAIQTAHSLIDFVIRPEIEQMDHVVQALAAAPEVEAYAVGERNDTLERVATLFMTVTRANHNLMQTRLLDAQGREVVRINRDRPDTAPYVVGKSQLQDKSGRDYFLAVKALHRPVLWHSLLDLNIEHRQVEIPHRPTYRIAMPLFEDGRFTGMVICNILVNDLLNAVGTSPLFDVYIIDNDGYYVLHPDARYRFNRYTGTPRTLQDDFGEDAPLPGVGGKGDGYYAFPLGAFLGNSDKSILVLKTKSTFRTALTQNNLIIFAIVLLVTVLVSIPLTALLARGPAMLQEELYRKNVELEHFFEVIDPYVISATITPEGMLLDVSRAFENVSGYTKADLENREMYRLLQPGMSEAVVDAKWKATLAGDAWKDETECLNKQGGSYWLKYTVFPIVDPGNEVSSYMLLGIDVTATKRLEALALEDQLTGLYNRRKIDECLEREVRNAERFNHPLSVLMMDVDHFKAVNDTYGHQRGDAILREIGGLIRGSVRTVDYAGRFGGEEFAVLCPETGKAGAAVLAEQIRGVIAGHVFEEVGSVTVSIGVAELEEGDDGDAVIRKADRALYTAKRSGRNRSVLG